MPSGKGHTRKTLLLNTTNNDSIYIIFGSRWKQAPLLPVYALISHRGNLKINIKSFPDLSSEIIKETTTLTDYLQEQTWHLSKKKKKKKLIKILKK